MENTKNKRNKANFRLYESVFAPVPKEEKRYTASLFFINMGYVAAFSCYLIGVKLGYVMPFWKAVLACILGNAFLTFIAGSMGLVAVRTGLSTCFLTRKVLGKPMSLIVSVVLIFLSIGWISMNADAFARIIIAVFSDFSLPIPVISMLLIVLWSVSASKGLKGIGTITYFAVPFIFIITFIGIIIIGRQTNDFNFLNSYRPTIRISFSMGVSMIIGNFIFGCTISPDVFRFASSDKAVYMGTFSYFFGLIVPNICGILIAQAGKTDDFTIGITRLGLEFLFFICIVFCLWTTVDNNVYSASLAVQNLFYKTPIEGNLSHKIITYIVSGLAGAFASLGVFRYLVPSIVILSFILPPLIGMILCEYFILKQTQKNKGKAIITWIISSIAGYLAYKQDFFVPSFISFITSVWLYFFLRRFWRFKIKNSR